MNNFSLEIENIFNAVAEDHRNPKNITCENFVFTALSLTDNLLCAMVKKQLNVTDLYAIQNELSNEIDSNITVRKPTDRLDFSDDFLACLLAADAECTRRKYSELSSELVFIQILFSNDTVKRIFSKYGITYKSVTDMLDEIDKKVKLKKKNSMSKVTDMGNGMLRIECDPGEDFDEKEIGSIIKNAISSGSMMMPPNGNNGETSIEDYCVDLYNYVTENDIDDLIGRDDEIKKIAKVLARKKCNNIVLVGESGVGKTALVYGIQKKIANYSLHNIFSNNVIYKLSIPSLLSGTQLRGSFETKVNALIELLRNSDEPCILFIDDVHCLLSDKKEEEFDFSGIFAEAFEDNNIPVIVATTPRGFSEVFAHNASFYNKFQRVDINETGESETLEILNGLRGSFERFHNVKFSDEVLKKIISLSKRYITNDRLPASAIGIMDEIGAMLHVDSLSIEKVKTLEDEIKEKLKNGAQLYDDDIISINDEILKEQAEYIKKNEVVDVTVDNVYKAISEHTNIPVSRLSSTDKKELSRLDEKLKKYIIGQGDAIDMVCQAIKRNKVGIHQKNAPIYSSFFIGESGVGKTYLAKRLASEIFGSEKYLVRFDMSEYSDKASVNKLIGSSAGYVGYESGGLLTEAIKNKKNCVLLIDEIEKADEQIYNVFLQILDDGFITDNKGEKVDFKNTIILFTSNIGTKKASLESFMGFNADQSAGKRSVIEKELKKKFPPEFINRIDNVVYFNSLSEENIRNIIKLDLELLLEQTRKVDVEFTYTDEVVELILKKALKEKEYGARPVARIIQSLIEDKITDYVIENDKEKYTFDFKVEDDSVCF